MPTWCIKLGVLYTLYIPETASSTVPTSEPKIVVVNSLDLFQFGYPNAASV